jgi:Superfamily II helicase
LNEGLEWLEDHGFIRVVDNEVSLTKLGSRVSDLYLNPFSANVLKEALENADEDCELAYLHAMAYTPDGPVVAVSKAEEDEMLDELDCDLLIGEPYDEVEMENYLSALKVAFITRDWIEEKEEDYILKEYSIGSGDLRTIIDAMDWLSYSTYHLAKVLEMDDKLDFLMKLHERVAEGVKEELLGLVKIRGIGRKRARLLYNAGIRKPEDLVMNPEKVKSLLGEKLGEQIVRKAGEFLSNLTR